ncbi:Ig-like domain-containing protein [Phototrophicus methaneseepsis]|uniref:Ig-like domain-containing protein n=1 Tax=Phototrophicus methaneseepsis TaxID=2710758 RepID=A0A7S8ICU8_9CHLR|nr:Ig-like domain-containing alpha-2-macroglobulin family protein [Phototrophicus methaneseepsis]QPC81915.1 Ig-like domain-containing protein [Phototrophicus methaneseepsis]
MLRRMSALLLMGLLLSVSLPAAFAQEESVGAVPSILQIIDSDPLVGQELALDEAITLYFDRDLDCETAQVAIYTTPETTGTVTCDGNMLVYTPDAGWERATTYTLTVDDRIRGADGAQLVASLDLDYSTTGFLSVVETFPAADSQVNPDTAITAIFNRPVVPLVIVEDMPDLPQPLSFSPDIEGTGEWINTSIYIFTPSDEGLAAGTTYTVSVDPSLVASDGAVFDEPYQWQFSTLHPVIEEYFPQPQESDVLLGTDLGLRFSQPMVPESVEEMFYLRADGSEGPSVSGTFEWSEDNAGFRFQPDDLLDLETLYVAGFTEPPAVASGGDLGDTPSWNFATVPYPSIVGTNPRDGEQTAPPYGGFTVNFSTEMDFETLPELITISPEPYREPEYYWGEWNDSYSVSFPTEPSTTYTITIAAGAADIYGNTIDEPYTFSYTTDRYSSELTLNVPGNIGFYNAERAPTELFISHRNISHVDLELYSMPTEALLDVLTNDNYYDPTSGYRPQTDQLLREWSIDSIAPENALRYELLNLGAGGFNAAQACPTAMEPRVKVGDVVRVITEPDPLRARLSPPEGEIVDLLYRDYTMPIVGGPMCTGNNLLWWQVELSSGDLAWVAEGFEDEYYIETTEEAQVTAIQVSADEEGRLDPGIYWLTAQTPEFDEQGWAPRRHIMVVSTAVLMMKASPDTVTVWATDVQTGLPLADVPIEVIFLDGVVGTGTTDADGIMTMDTPRELDLYSPRLAVLNTDDQFGLAFGDWDNGISPWMFNVSSDFYPSRYRLYAYTDRPVYRPGQPVYFRGVVRDKDDVTYTRPEFETVPVQITDNNGEVVYKEDLTLSPYGTFHGELELADGASLGSYYLSVELPSERDYGGEGGGVGFSVAEYRLPEFTVDVTAAEGEIVQGDTAEITIDSTYFFGGSVRNADVHYTIISSGYYFDYEGQGRYDFVAYDADGGPSEYYGSSGGFIGDGDAVTDDQGMVTIEVPAELEDATQSQVFTIEAAVTDESNQVVAGRTEVIVHKGLVYVGAGAESYVSTAGEEAVINIVSVDWDSESVPNQTIDVEVVERRWSSVQERDDTGRTTWSYEVEEIPVTEDTVTTDENGEATFSFVPPNGGIYKVTVTTLDEAGNEVRASTNMWVSDTSYVPWRQQNSNRIDVIADQDNYEVGDVAEILITSPFQGEAEAVITVERGDLLSIEHVTMDSNSYIYRLPIDETFAPNAFISAYVVKGVDENNPVAGFRIGYTEFSVEIDRKELTVDITSDVDEAQPQQTVNYTVEVTDWQGNPVQAEVGVGVTDLAALSLMPPNSGPLLTFFYGEQSLSIRTSTPLTINTDQLTQETLDTIKGGGGGGDMVEGIVEIRGEFIDTPYWNPSIITDEDGTASFDVRLPDNLTTWRLDARAITSGDDGLTLVGQDTFDLISTKPVLIRPSTPRFFVVGDHVTLGAVVNNNTDEDQDVVVTMQSTGLTVEGDASQTVTVPAHDTRRVVWNVEVQVVDSVVLAFTADAGDYSDGAVSSVSLDDEGTLPVYRYEVPETVGTAGVLRTADTRVESIVLPRRFDTTQGEVTITTDHSLAAAALDSLYVLVQDDDRSIESVVSRFLPNIATMRTLQAAGLDVESSELQAALDSVVSLSLQQLLAQQKSDGGWGWYFNDRSDEMVTAYALLGLSEARDAGYPVSESVISDAQSFLQRRLIPVGPQVSRWQMDRQSMLLYALARSGAPDVARTVNLYENRQFLSLYAQALLAQNIYLFNPDDDVRLDALANELVNAAEITATGIRWHDGERTYYNWSTDTRTTAMIVSALIKLRPESDLIPGAIRYLMTQRQADRWETRQETAWVLMTLSEFMTLSGELQPDYTYSVSVNGDEMLQTDVTPDNVSEDETLVIEVADLFADQANQLSFTRSEGEGALYYTAHLRAFLPVPDVEPLERGIILERRYTLLDDPDQTPITEAHVGDLVQVRLTIILPNSRHYVVVEDPLPAGAEAVDPGLSTSQQVGTRPTLDSEDPLSRGWGWWWFSSTEFMDEKVVLHATYLPAGTYEYVYTMRAGLEGVYNVIPATGQEVYFPEVYGRSAGSTFTILPADE